jgi:threonine aldolase
MRDDQPLNGPSRRRFIEMSGAVAAAFGVPLPHPTATGSELAASTTVHLSGDGLNLDPSEAAAEIVRLCAAEKPVADQYGLTGCVEDVEKYFATLLGKERALFMPTGTLANHLAIRALARDRRRVAVQEMSHIYNDTGDASQILSGLTLMPLAPEKATFTWTDVEHVIARTTSGRVPDPLGAIVVESPVRRLSGELFDRGEMLRVCAEARRLGIGLHLDGARLFIASAYTGISPAEYAAPFDTVYVSLWKYFNSLNGAILAGPSALLDGMFNVRRMFGGALWNAWPFALLARHFAEGFVDRLKLAIAVSDDFIRAVDPSRGQIERIPNGTNIFRLVVAEPRADAARERLRAQAVMLSPAAKRADKAAFILQVNETWNRTTGVKLADLVNRALAP